ncbi:FtsX-like permease family protein [Prosthecochloris sp. SCSIO W1101]|uniref:ABC transporter permease n=1 Tax=Prosthecochloris sp. SCSIO W1101 TaxID=2992242 RepID=UPI00223D0013|nr:FtsX-like permease family protein [Prosthecochloris sp. SCSIO W1101]UZJ41266.1 FtsX-like permease family protein [Prosthecochloris sp. SCSIO W1101]
MNIVKLATIALRNLFRNSRRTLITVLVSAAGFAALAILAGYMDFSFYGLRELTVCKGFTAGGGTGHIQIFNRESLQKEELFPLQYGIEANEKIRADIESIEKVSFTMPRIEFNGLISNGDKSISFLGLGVDPEKEAGLIQYWNSLEKMAGKSMSDAAYRQLENTGAYGVLLGQQMAKTLNAGVGTDLMLMSTTVDGAVNVVDVKVAGIIRGAMKSIDRHYLVAPLETAMSLLQTDRVSKIVVVLKQTEDTAPVGELIEVRLRSQGDEQVFSVVPWEELATYYYSVRDVYNIIFSFTGIIVVALVFLSCTNTMLMATMERVREIGTLKAIGVSNAWVGLMFLFEGFFIGILSVAGGLVFKYIFSVVINNSNFKMPPPPGMSTSYLLKIFSAVEFLPWIALLIILSTTLSGLLTLLKIRKISIVNSLTHV